VGKRESVAKALVVVVVAPSPGQRTNNRQRRKVSPRLSQLKFIRLDFLFLRYGEKMDAKS